jgi:hypothetical protein
MDRRRAGGGSPIDFTSVTGYVGWDFAANTDLTLTGLGFCDADGNGLAESHAVGRYSSTGTLLVSGIVPSGTAENWLDYFGLSLSLRRSWLLGPAMYLTR